MNRIQVIGQLQVEPQLHILPNGEAICHFVILDSQAPPDSKIDSTEECGYFSVTAWGQLAKQCGQLKKGSRVYVLGQWRKTKYVGLDGQQCFGYEIILSHVHVIAPTSSKIGGNTHRAGPQPAPAHRSYL